MTKLSRLSSALTKLGSLKAATKVASLIKVAFGTPDEFRVVFNILLKGGSGADKVIGPLRHAMRQHKEMADEVLSRFTDDEREAISMVLDRSITSNITTDIVNAKPNRQQSDSDYWYSKDSLYEDMTRTAGDLRIETLKESVSDIIRIGTIWLSDHQYDIFNICKDNNLSFEDMRSELISYINFNTPQLVYRTRTLMIRAGIKPPSEFFSNFAKSVRQQVCDIYAESDNKI